MSAINPQDYGYGTWIEAIMQNWHLLSHEEQTKLKDIGVEPK